ncbi:16831_t:CDS:1, partial [Funneliformis geosporum]
NFVLYRRLTPKLCGQIQRFESISNLKTQNQWFNDHASTVGFAREIFE